VTAGGLGPAELDALLSRPILGRLATVDPDGYPAIVPIWFEWDGSAILLVARGRARYLDDIRREPRVGFSVVADSDPDVRVHLRGRAKIVTDPAVLEGETLALARRLAERYEGPAGLDYIDASRSLERCVVRIVPERTISWGSPDWHPRYLDPDPGGADDRV
jgi:PPOX class probable F420-dependent enzyme